MRHKKLGRQFSRDTSHRRAMFRALTANLVLHDRIETTEAKAKELRRVVERLITHARKLGPAAYTPWADLNPADRSRRLAAVRQVSQFLARFGVSSDKDGKQTKVDLVQKVFTVLAERYATRPGGYTRIIKIGQRRGDAAPMVFIELVGSEDAAEEAPAEEAKAAA